MRAWQKKKKKRTSVKNQESKKGENQYLIFQVNFFPNVAQPHQRFFICWVHFARWASVTAAELCSFSGDHHTTSLRPWRTASSAAESISWQSGEKTNKSANGNERNKCLESAKQKARKQSRDICQKWKKRQRFHFSTAAINRLPKQSHLFLLDLDLNWSYGQQIIHAQVLLRGGKVLKNKTPTKSAPCVWINVSACKHMATEQRSTSANSGVKAPISS